MMKKFILYFLAVTTFHAQLWSVPAFAQTSSPTPTSGVSVDGEISDYTPEQIAEIMKALGMNPDGSYNFTQEAELALLQSIRARVEYYMQFNKIELSQMVECLRQRIYRPDEVNVIIKYKDDPKLKVRHRDTIAKFDECGDRIGRVKNNIMRNYAPTRRALMLYNMATKSNMFYILEKMRDKMDRLLGENHMPRTAYVMYDPTRDYPVPMKRFDHDHPMADAFFTSIVVSHPKYSNTEYKFILDGPAGYMQLPIHEADGYPDSGKNAFTIEIAEPENPGKFSTYTSSSEKRIQLPFLNNFQGYVQLACQLQAQRDFKHYCNDVKLRWSDKDVGFYIDGLPKGKTKEEHRELLRGIFGYYYNYSTKNPQTAPVKNFFEVFEDTLKDEFFEMVRKFPYVALVNSAFPDDTTVLYAMIKMERAALDVYTKFVLKEFPPRLFSSLPRSKQIKMMDYGPIVDHIVQSYADYQRAMHADDPEVEDDDPTDRVQTKIPAITEEMAATIPNQEYLIALAEELASERAWDRLAKAGWQTLGLIALNAACFLIPTPGSKIKGLKLLARLSKGGFTRGMCFSALTLPVAVYFLHSSFTEYRDTWKKIFSVPAGHVGLAEMSCKTRQEYLAELLEEDPTLDITIGDIPHLENKVCSNFDKSGDSKLSDPDYVASLDSGQRYLIEISELRTAERFFIFDLVLSPLGAGQALKALWSGLAKGTIKMSGSLRKQIEKAIIEIRKERAARRAPIKLNK